MMLYLDLPLDGRESRFKNLNEVFLRFDLLYHYEQPLLHEGLLVSEHDL